MVGKLSSIRVDVSAPLLRADKANPSVGPVNYLIMKSERALPCIGSVRATIALVILLFPGECLW